MQDVVENKFVPATCFVQPGHPYRKTWEIQSRNC